jgi:hypothetical protein
MFDLLKTFYYKVENLKGRKLYASFAIVFLVFIAIGLTVGYFTSPELTEDETPNNPITKNRLDYDQKELSGKVQYIDPSFYPEDEISYRLLDKEGKQMVLLKATDEKLSIVEGLTVTVRGTRATTKDNKEEVLIVREVIFKNATD